MRTNDWKCNKIEAIYSFTTLYKLIFIVDTHAIIQKLTLIQFLTFHLQWSIFRDGYISRNLEILVFSEMYNWPKNEKIPIREI